MVDDRFNSMVKGNKATQGATVKMNEVNAWGDEKETQIWEVFRRWETIGCVDNYMVDEEVRDTPRFPAGLMRDDDAVLIGKAGRAGWWLEWRREKQWYLFGVGLIYLWDFTSNEMVVGGWTRPCTFWSPGERYRLEMVSVPRLSAILIQ